MHRKKNQCTCALGADSAVSRWLPQDIKQQLEDSEDEQMARRRNPRVFRARDPTRHTRASNATDNQVGANFDIRFYAPAVSGRRRRRRQQVPATLASMIFIHANEVIPHLDQREIVVLRGVLQTIRNNVPRPACQNFSHLPYSWIGNRTPGMPNPNPWSHSFLSQPVLFFLPGQVAQCQNDGSAPIHMQRCQGHERNLQPAHGRNHWVCRPCVDSAWQQYDFTRFPPWFKAMCMICSVNSGLANHDGCECAQTYSPAGECWLCSDCRRQHSYETYLYMIQEANGSLPVQDPNEPATSIRRWISHGDATVERQFCLNTCGNGQAFSWNQLLASYPPSTMSNTGRNLTSMTRQCLMCDLECWRVRGMNIDN